MICYFVFPKKSSPKNRSGRNPKFGFDPNAFSVRRNEVDVTETEKEATKRMADTGATAFNN